MRRHFHLMKRVCCSAVAPLFVFCAFALCGIGVAQISTDHAPTDLPGIDRQAIDLPTSKQLRSDVAAEAKPNNLPMTLAVSPDGKWIALLNGGYGTFESQYEQSIAVM